MATLEIAYLSHPLGESGKWIIISESGDVVFTASDADTVQNYLDALLSESEF